MVQERTLKDTAKDSSAKEAFIKQGTKKPILVMAATKTKMLNTRIPKELIKRIKVYCAEHETTMQDFITEAIQEKLA